MADVICPQCGGRYHETTAAYNPGVTTRGNMLSLKKMYKDNAWESFPEHEGIAFGALECPECGGGYTSNGIVRIDEEQYQAEIESMNQGGRDAWTGKEYALANAPKKKAGRPRKTD